VSRVTAVNIDARGLVFDVTAGGPEDGEPALLLHGFPQNSAEWEAVAPILHAGGLRTYAMDLRGYTPGARPDGVDAYRMEEYVADALAVLDALGVEAAHVVGHDCGAVVGWWLGVDHPDRVRTFTAVSVPHPAAYAAALRSDPDQRTRSSYIGLFRIAGKAEDVLLRDGARRLRAIVAPTGERAGRYADPLTDPAALTGALNWYRAVSFDRMAGLGPMTRPTTFVWSDEDLAIGRAAADGCAAHVAADYSFVTLTGVSHWIPDEAPDALAGAVLARVTG
jgi:pimeloyl-ACP methyl ester carboxylesterase